MNPPHIAVLAEIRRSSFLESDLPESRVPGSSHKINFLPDAITQLLEETDYGYLPPGYNFSPELLDQKGEITEAGLRKIITTIREADREHHGLACVALAEAVVKNIKAKCEDYTGLDDIDSFSQGLLEIVNEDDNKPNIQAFDLNSSQIEGISNEASVADFLTVVADLAVKNRINAKTVLDIIAFTELKLNGLKL